MIDNSRMTVSKAVRRVLHAAAGREVVDLARAFAIAGYSIAAISPAAAAELPVPCIAGSCGTNGPATWVTSGNATAIFNSNSLTVNQTTNNLVLNWQSFNISKDGTVTFQQPDANSIALNRIYQNNPSQIFGALNANGRVYLVNQNGILFGDGARVNVGGLVASAINIALNAQQNGITQPAKNNAPAFEAGVDDPDSSVVIQQGARIETASGGQVFLFAPESVTNEGTISTPDGQTILAAGRSVYLATSSDENLRGIVVEVHDGGEVNNGRVGGATGRTPQDVVGQIVAERGNITLAGLAVNQHGRLSATTSVRANGTIRLQARDTVQVEQVSGVSLLRAQRGGELTVGPDAITEVTLAHDDAQTQVDVNKQLASTITMDGAQVRLLERSRTTATSGNVTITARTDPQASPTNGSYSPDPNDGRLYIANEATIDVSGAQVVLPMERNVVRAELRGSQVANSPEQRDGALRGQAVYVDVRRSGTREDGTTWQGTPLADLSGDIAAVARTVEERSLRGGTVTLHSQGSVLIAQDSLIDISGGNIQYQDGFVNTTQLLSAGRTYDIGDADPNRRYEGIGNVLVVDHPKWGVSETFTGYGTGTQGRFEQGYIEGKDAGTVSIVAPWLALDGRIDGSVVRGPHQRLPGGTLAENQIYRAHNQVPMGGRLEIGFADTSDNRNAVVGDVRIAPGLVLPTLLNDDGTPFDPEKDLLPVDRDDVLIRPELLGGSSVSRLAVYSNGRITVPADVQISTPAGGQFAATGANLQIDGQISSPSGSIDLAARTTRTHSTDISLLVGPEARLNAVGRWVNDSPLINAPGALLDALFVDGGRVNLSSQQGELQLAHGSVIDVSGGASRASNGSISSGRGGSVSISTSPDSTNGKLAAPVPLILDAEIRAHSVGAGGQLSITASAICISSEDCSADEQTVLWLRPELLEDSGFGSYRLNSNRGGLSVAPATQISLQQRNLVLTGELGERASAESVVGFSQLARLDDFQRRPVDLTLNVAANPGTAVSSSADFSAVPGLLIGTGSSILGDMGAGISLRSNSRMIIDGFVSAPAGSISAELNADLTLNQFFPASQAIWLGERARLSATGAARVRTDDLGRRQGDMLAGGTVSLTAQRGYVIASPGSVIDVSGTAATLDIRSDSRGSVLASNVASDAGRISVTAAEGFFLGGDFAGHAGGASARGGELSLTLNPAQRNDAGNPVSWFPAGPRVIEVQERESPIVIAPGASVPSSLNGFGAIAASDVEQGGFDALSLTARELQGRLTAQEELRSRGVIRFDGDVQLSLGRSITLDASTIDARNGSVMLAAPVVSIGASSRMHQSLPAIIEGGSGQLSVQAGLLDFYGNVALQGVADADFSSTGDIRFRGVQLEKALQLNGSLVSAGDMTFTARQLYPGTLTNFDIRSRGSQSTIRVRGIEGARAPVLSAGGNLALHANTIVNDGVLRAPFGSIELSGNRIEMLAGSIASTSADGLLIPFGQTQGGFDWVYPLLDQGGPNAQTLVFGRGGAELPQQRVTLDGADIRIQTGATIDLSGGGDLLAYEFEPGVGGTLDVLSNTYRPNQYAIVPTLGLDYAPFDQNLFEGSNLRMGDSVYLSGMPGLAAGTYALLPARYALLPGAYLVSAVDGYQDILPGERFAQLDGGTVVAGYRSVAGTGVRDTRSGGFAVRAGSDAQREAHYEITRATEFFPAQAVRQGTAALRLPNDAGILSINAGGQLLLDGSLRAAAGTGGRGAAADISGTRLRIVDGNATAEDGEVLIDAAALRSLGAESVLLGARRSQTAEGVLLDVSADQVIVDSGAELVAPELLLAATDRVEVRSGASITAGGRNSNADEALLVNGDGALFRASSGEQMRIERTGDAGAQGTLNIAAGAVISARNGAVLFDATRDTQSSGELDVAGASLNLAAARISLGDVPDSAEGLLLEAGQFSGLDLRELVLTSRSVLDLYGRVNLGVRDLTVHAGGIVSRTGGDASLTASDTLHLANPNGVTTPSMLDGAGSLTLTARNIKLGAGDFAVQGVSDTRFSASNQIIGEQSGSTRVSGNLQLGAARITTSSAADRTITASGALTTLAFASATDTQTSTTIPGVGGRLNLQGASIFHAGRIEMPSGNVRLEALGPDASGGVTLGGGSVLALAGSTRTFDGVDVSVPGGVATFISRNGSVIAQSGSTVDVSGAAAGGDAGKIMIEAAHGAAVLAGTLLGRATAAHEGGSISIDAATLNGFDALTGTLNFGGFNQSRTFRQRGPGDLVVSADPSAAIAVRHVSLTADQGSTLVNGLIDARGNSGGSISLAARDNVVVTGTLLANATAAGGRGGHVLMSSTDGGVLTGAAARIDVSAGAAKGAEPVRAGEVMVRLPHTAVLSVLDDTPDDDQLRLDGAVVGAGRYWVEGYQAYVDADGILDDTDVAAFSSPLYSDAASFMTNASAIADALHRPNDPAFKVVPGVEVRSDDDLTLAADWNLYNWHFANDAPGILTLRAGGNLIFDRSLSDGFATLPDPFGFDPDAAATAFVLGNQRRESWSYRLIGGADLTSADTLAVRSSEELPDSGDVKLSAGTCCVPSDPFNTPDYRMIRTGTGDITIRAARDLVFGNPTNRSVLDQTAMIYTAGVSGPGIRLPGDFGGINSLPYPVDGGDISIHTGRAVRGAPSDQLVSDWLWRVGSQPDSFGPGSPTAWTVNYASFMQGVGALAGGNIEIVAGGDVENVSLNLPTIGRQVGGLEVSDNAVEVIGAGNLRVDAGGSILGGTYLIGNGSARLRSQESITAPEVPQTSGLRPVGSLLGIVGNGGYDLVARKNVEVESVFNATLIRQGNSQQAFSTQSFFYTYGDQSAADLLSVSGDVVFHNDPAIARMFGSASLSDVDAAALQIYPGTVRATGFDGNVEVLKSMLLSPASKGNLELFAQNDVLFGDGTDALVLTLSDSDPAVLPSIYHPANNIGLLNTLLKSPTSDPNQHGAVPVHSLAAQADGIADSSPVRVVARTGDIYMNTSLEGGVTGLYLAKQSRFIAGGDIRELSLFGQHVADGDVTTLYAGRAISYGLRRHSSGILAGSAGAIVLDGPGNLEVIAGRHVDLQASDGILTQGNLRNPALQDGGASVSVLTGVGSRSPDYAAFGDAYLRDTTAHDESLMAFLAEITGAEDLSKSQALGLFATLTEGQRNGFLQSVLFAELRASGRDAARTGNGDFTRGFDALETLFPGSNPDTEAGETNPYIGDFNGYFSRVYTLDGGDINLLAPGGQINVGLATPPASFGITKRASELGVVAQSTGNVSALAFNDFLVNESRVFSADGGDILVWSTRGDIDAGRGAKTAISAPAPTVSFDANGNVQVTFPAALAGSGIQTLATSPGRKPGNVDLFAPRGVVNAGDAGIVAGNLTIAATAVLGADNIQVSGVAVGVPVDTGGLGASLAGVSSVASGASNAAASVVETNRGQEEQQASLADTALSWLEVFVIGLGEDNCKQDDVECLKRQTTEN